MALGTSAATFAAINSLRFRLKNTEPQSGDASCAFRAPRASAVNILGSSQRWSEWRRSTEIAEIRKGNDTYKLGERKSGVACS